MITRRHFLKALASTTALVAVPGAAFATVNHDKIMALLESKMAEAKSRIISDSARLFYGDDSETPRDFGLQALIDDKTLQEIHVLDDGLEDTGFGWYSGFDIFQPPLTNPLR